MIDEKACHKPDGKFQYSRQKVAAFLKRHTNTRAAGFVFTQIKDTFTGRKDRPISQYSLKRSENEQ